MLKQVVKLSNPSLIGRKTQLWSANVKLLGMTLLSSRFHADFAA